MTSRLARFAALTAAALTASLALAASVGFEIKPNGPQVLDPVSGVVSLPRGGSVRSAKYGVTVEGSTIELKQDDFLKATNATMKGDDIGTIRAQKLDYRVKADRAEVSGTVSYASRVVKLLTAARGVAYPDAAKVVVLGKVRSTSPSLSADTVVVDSGRNEVLLSGNFSYTSSDGRTNIVSRPGAEHLLLSFGGASTPNRVSTDIPQNILNSYTALIERSR